MDNILLGYYSFIAKGGTSEEFLKLLRIDVDKEVMSKFNNPREAMKASTALYKSRVSDLKKAIHQDAGKL